MLTSIPALALAATLFTTSIQAFTPQTAIVTIETTQSGKSSNKTVHIPFTTPYTDEADLQDISHLYLTGSTGATLSTVGCTPFHFANGTGIVGQFFTSGRSVALPGGATTLGSIVCFSSEISAHPPSLTSTATDSTATSAASSKTTKIDFTSSAPAGVKTTHTKTSGTKTDSTAKHSKTKTTTAVASTKTAGTSTASGISTAAGSGSSSGTLPSSTSTGTSSAASSTSTSSSGRSLVASSEVFAGLAVAGLGVAFVL